MTPDQPVPFRAGRAEQPPGMAPHFATPSAVIGNVVLLADCSEFQPDIADAIYLRWSQAIVIRALYGTRVDKAWYGGARRGALHAGGARFIGIYAYITAQDITAQAKALISLLGKLRPGEKLIADLEEGPGSQQARWQTWAKVITAATGDPPWCYSGLNYARDHGLEPVTWVAAYGTTEPAPAHELWQFTDQFTVPGVGVCDASVFHGPIGDLAALAYQGAKPVPRRTLTQGMTGPAVRTLQQALNAHGYHLAADGVFGPATRAAVLSFQVQRGLAADGICGPLTWAKLA
jgi:Putative peptidoglycan binding domain/Glycosyl hydrolases family 25